MRYLPNLCGEAVVGTHFPPGVVHYFESLVDAPHREEVVFCASLRAESIHAL